jgi:glyoxylase-like metal-dependent hydrolase (beta-lactamase superfamily II)
MRKKLVFVLVPIVLALLCLAWSFAPTTIAPLQLELEELPSAHAPAGMSISALPTADIHSRAGFAFRGGAFSEPRVFSQTALLVRHPRGDLLIDTGLGTHARDHFETMPWLMRSLTQLDLRTPAAAQLSAAGYTLSGLVGLVPTHIHWDHISGVPDFPGVPVWLNAREHAFARDGGHSSALYRSFGELATKEYAFAPRAYLGFERSFDVWGDGSIVLVPAPGHSPGSILAFIALPSGKRFVLLGDLVWQSDGIMRPAERPGLTGVLVDDDGSQVRHGIAHVAAIARRFPELVLLPAHDDRAWSKLPVFPRSLE